MPETSSLAGRKFGGYEVLDLVVREKGVERYRARQTSLARLVDLTVLSPESARRPASALRFERIQSVTVRLRHENVIAAIDAGDHLGWRYFVTEHVEGTTLADALARKETFTPARILEIGHGVARAVAYLDEVGVVHRDVAPHTIVAAPGLPVKLTGFLTAKATSRETSETWFDTETVDAAYISPERIRGDRGVDAKSDLYSLGCVLYRLVAGRPPFHGAPAAAILDAHRFRRPRDPRTIVPDLSPGLVRVLDRCLRKDPATRYDSPSQLAADLHALRAGAAPPTPDRGPVLWRRKG